MPFLGPDDILNSRIDLIVERFPADRMEFSSATFDSHLELHVYVLDAEADKVEAVTRYCRDELEKLNVEPNIPVWIIVKPWSGSWPASENSVREFNKWRKDFEARVAARYGTPHPTH